MSAIAETVSENTPKRKRGRPKSFIGEHLESMERSGFGPINVNSRRAKIDHVYRLAFIGEWARSDAQTQARIMGCTHNEIRSGTHNFPSGFDTAATEIGRWLEKYGGGEELVARTLDAVATHRANGISWQGIRLHFRKLRLGARKGNAMSLFMHIARAYDDYVRRFPATTQQMRIAGIQNLMDAVNSHKD